MYCLQQVSNPRAKIANMPVLSERTLRNYKPVIQKKTDRNDNDNFKK